MATRWMGTALVVVMVLGVLAALAAGFSLARQPDASGLEVSASASGEALVVSGDNPFDLARARPAAGRVDVTAVDDGGRWSALQSKDTMNLAAEFTDPRDGSTYRVVVNTPMRQEPEGRYTTWFGVALNHAHHGDTGIDTPALPRVAAELALWGFADVFRDGTLVAAGKPAHMMVVQRDQGALPAQVFLEVAAERKDLVGVPDGYLSLAWRRADSLSTPATQGIDETSRRESNAGRAAAEVSRLVQYGRREVVGYGVLLFLVAGTLYLALRPWPGARQPGRERA